LNYVCDSLPSFAKVRYQAAVDGVATIVLDDPETRNALSEQLLGELLSALRDAKADAAARVVVISSSHEKVFSAGANLVDFGANVSAADRYMASGRFVEVFRELGELGKPSILAANGHVLAGSLGLALACDLIIASELATFGTPEINVGLFPFMIMALIYRNVPRKKTNEMLLLGDRLSAEQALEAGIVNKIVSADQLEATVGEWAQKLAAKSPLVMRLGKDAIWRQMDMSLLEGLDYLRAQLAIELSTEDAAEGVSAFLEKRNPEWKGR
jgi:enoyl-CoA hydratase/carnithine racemase